MSTHGFSNDRRPLIYVGTTVALCILLTIHAQQYQPFLSDDALISLRYARRLLDGDGLTWTDGRPVEGYSNLLWIVLSAFWGFWGVDLIASVRINGHLCMFGVLSAIAYMGYRDKTPSLLGVIAAGLLFALSGAIAAWTIGGLEQPLVACLLAWTVVWTYPLLEFDGITARGAIPASICLGLLCLTRPDGPLFSLSVGLILLLIHRPSRRTFRMLGVLEAVPALCVLGQLLFRKTYYGVWVPNTALVKLAPSDLHFKAGLNYLEGGMQALLPFSVVVPTCGLAIMLFGRNPRARGRLGLLSLCATLWAIYLVVIGGDIFPAWRHFVPLIVLLAFGLAVVMDGLVLRSSGRRCLVSSLVMALGFVAYLSIQFRNDRNQDAMTEDWEWEGRVIGLMLKRGFGPRQPLLAVSASGCYPYWSELPALDILGLNDFYLPRHPPKNFGAGGLGHELGDGAYVLRRNPDLILFGPRGSKRLMYRTGRQLERRPAFWNRYALSRFEGREPFRVSAYLWVNRKSAKIGIQQTRDHIFVPSYFLTHRGTNPVYLDQENTFRLEVTPTQRASMEGLEVPAGIWRVTVRGTSGTRVRIEGAEQSTDQRVVWEDLTPTELKLSGQSTWDLDITITSESGTKSHVEGVELTRL